nr:MAG TPA: THROMBIN, TRIABIN THROMBIN, THROMBIN INHIBITOR, COMPLEX.6A [Caudoviricetes sp.]
MCSDCPKNRQNIKNNRIFLGKWLTLPQTGTIL